MKMLLPVKGLTDTHSSCRTDHGNGCTQLLDGHLAKVVRLTVRDILVAIWDASSSDVRARYLPVISRGYQSVTSRSFPLVRVANCPDTLRRKVVIDNAERKAEGLQGDVLLTDKATPVQEGVRDRQRVTSLCTGQETQGVRGLEAPTLVVQSRLVLLLP